MPDIICDFHISHKTAQADRARYSIEGLDRKRLAAISDGRMFIAFNSIRQYLVIEGPVIDYMIQLRSLFSYMDSGNTKTSSVSGDYCSNALEYTYSKKHDIINVYDIVSGDFDIAVCYSEFRSTYIEFYNASVEELLAIYPELGLNNTFKECFKQ